MASCPFAVETTTGEGYLSFLEFDEPEAFVKFMAKATAMRSSKEYKQLYRHLLRCFTDADHRKVGVIDFDSFDRLIEVAAVAPRKFGFAPATTDSFKTEEERRASRLIQFNTMDTTMGGVITFDEFLYWALTHIRSKVVGSKAEFAPSDVAYPVVLDDAANAPLYDHENTTEAEFIDFLQKAIGDRESRQYRTLYYHLLRCFTAADSDLTGRISVDDFDGLIEMAAIAPRHFGFAPTADMLFSSPKERREAREALFKTMSNGFFEIAFDDFLSWALAHIQEKIKHGVKIYAVSD